MAFCAEFAPCGGRGGWKVLRIALCDDEEKQLRDTAALLEAYLSARSGCHGQVETFPGAAALLERTEDMGGFDLYILDILMPELSGIDAGRRLRQLGDGGEIIYLTNSNDFAADSYEVRAFFYLLKPVEAGKLFQVLDAAVEKLKQRRSEGVLVRTGAGPRRILFERIRYVERVGRCMRYYCTDGTVDSQSIRSSFKEAAAPLLDDRRFYLCGASFVVNFQHVTGVSGQTALLNNGQTVSLPRAVAADFKRAWGIYWLGKENLP